MSGSQTNPSSTTTANCDPSRKTDDQSSSTNHSQKTRNQTIEKKEETDEVQILISKFISLTFPSAEIESAASLIVERLRQQKQQNNDKDEDDDFVVALASSSEFVSHLGHIVCSAAIQGPERQSSAVWELLRTIVTADDSSIVLVALYKSYPSLFSILRSFLTVLETTETHKDTMRMIERCLAIPTSEYHHVQHELLNIVKFSFADTELDPEVKHLGMWCVLNYVLNITQDPVIIQKNIIDNGIAELFASDLLDDPPNGDIDGVLETLDWIMSVGEKIGTKKSKKNPNCQWNVFTQEIAHAGGYEKIKAIAGTDDEKESHRSCGKGQELMERYFYDEEENNLGFPGGAKREITSGDDEQQQMSEVQNDLEDTHQSKNDQEHQRQDEVSDAPKDIEEES